MNTVIYEWSIDSWLNSKLLNDDQKVITTVRDYDPWWWWNPRTKVIIRIRNSDIIDYDVFVRENTSLFRNLRDLSKRIDDVVVLRILLQLVTSAIFFFFHLDTSGDGSDRATVGVVVQKLLARTSTEVVTRFRRWYRCPSLCQRSDLELAYSLARARRDSWNSSFFKKDGTVDVGHPTADFWLGRTFDGRLTSGGEAGEGVTRTVFIDLYDTFCVIDFLSTPSWRPFIYDSSRDYDPVDHIPSVESKRYNKSDFQFLWRNNVSQ